MALLCDYQKYGATFNDAYIRIERLQYVAKPQKVSVRVQPTLEEDGTVTTPEPNQTEVTIETLKRCNLVVAVYHSEASRTAAEAPIELNSEYIFEVAEGSTLDLFDQGYNYLKTLPEFTGAVDA